MIKHSFTALGALTLALGSLAFAQPAMAAAGAHATFQTGGPYHVAPGSRIGHASIGNRVLDYSTNWSGYAVTGGTFTTATATWIQNAGTCTSGDGQTDMSPWVGLDGFSDSTVEQTGTSVDCNGASSDYYAWYEMYPAGVVIINKTVKAGDSFTGTVTHTSGTTYKLVLTNNTEGWTFSVSKKLSAKDSSAEAVMEMAANSLTKFGTDPFTSFTVDGKAVGSYTGSGYTIEQMEIKVGSTLCDSTSALSNEENFTTTWLNAC
ncbi:G1 family glutamic endopeptidase [Actinospica sp.]|uniref:G1 family glutamic endopeptidase n=1 Tax=Actinospica sp. TaxID=1872142 RepID=UPI002C18A24A|nr:G1 family glutamic endopeptidase [Actinospica sp.]HWG26280.1 G1 family glutamic endopeptidase [Actinospica sp.]